MSQVSVFEEEFEKINPKEDPAEYEEIEIEEDDEEEEEEFGEDEEE